MHKGELHIGEKIIRCEQSEQRRSKKIRIKKTIIYNAYPFIFLF